MNQIRRVEKPWGFEIWWAHTDQYAGKLLHVEQGRRLSLQYHQHKDESSYLLSGRVRLSKGPGIDELVTTLVHPGDCWHTRPGEVHTVEALEPSEILEASTPQLEDVIRLMDDYGRASDRSPEIAHPVPTPPARLLDRDLIAARLGVRRNEVGDRMSDPSFPDPAGYFRGRMLWEEAAVDAWVNQPADASAAELRAG